MLIQLPRAYTFRYQHFYPLEILLQTSISSAFFVLEAPRRVSKRRVRFTERQNALVRQGLHLFQQPEFIEACREGKRDRQNALVELGLHIFQQPEFIEANTERQHALLRQ